MEAIRIEYRKKYNASLIDALRGDTSSTFEDIIVQLAQGSRELGETVNRKKAQSDAKRLYQVSLLTFLTFLAFRDHLHIFVGQSSPSFSSIVCFQSCQLSFQIF